MSSANVATPPHPKIPKHLQNTFRLCEIVLRISPASAVSMLSKAEETWASRSPTRSLSNSPGIFVRRPKIPQTRQPCPVEVQWGIQRNLPVDTGYGCLNEDEDQMRCNMGATCLMFSVHMRENRVHTIKLYTKNMSWLTLQNIWHHLAL